MGTACRGSGELAIEEKARDFYPASFPLLLSRREQEQEESGSTSTEMCCNKGSCSSMQRQRALPQPLRSMQLKRNQEYSLVISQAAWALQQGIRPGCTITGRYFALCFSSAFSHSFQCFHGHVRA